MGSAVLAAGLTLPWRAAGSATDGGSEAGGGSGKLVVWDWKSGDDSAAAYVEQAKADFAEQHPDATVEFVTQRWVAGAVIPRRAVRRS
jgi:multiple sugar transport system substrate-binding protein